MISQPGAPQRKSTSRSLGSTELRVERKGRIIGRIIDVDHVGRNKVMWLGRDLVGAKAPGLLDGVLKRGRHRYDADRRRYTRPNPNAKHLNSESRG